MHPCKHQSAIGEQAGKANNNIKNLEGKIVQTERGGQQSDCCVMQLQPQASSRKQKQSKQQLCK